jgi:hypothetical protein
LYPVLDPDTSFMRIPFKPHDLTARITPLEGLFVLAHLGVPRVDPLRWTLTLDGLGRHPVANPFSFRTSANAQQDGGRRVGADR